MLYHSMYPTNILSASYVPSSVLEVEDTKVQKKNKTGNQANIVN